MKSGIKGTSKRFRRNTKDMRINPREYNKHRQLLRLSKVSFMRNLQRTNNMD